MKDSPADTSAFDADRHFSRFQGSTFLHLFERGAGLRHPQLVLRVGVNADIGLGDGLGGLDGSHGGTLGSGEEGRRRGVGESRLGDGGQAAADDV